MTYKQFFSFITANIDNSYEIKEIIAHIGYDYNIFTDSQDIIKDETLLSVYDIINRRKLGQPLSRILGKKGFWDLDLDLHDNVFDPRPDSEVLIEGLLKVFDVNAGIKILELGVGSGALILSALTALPNSVGLGVDLSVDCCICAKKNAIKHGVADRCNFIVSDWCDGIRGGFDCIISNPPYIALSELLDLQSNVYTYDPWLALIGDGGTDCGSYEMIIPSISKHLNIGGSFFLEITNHLKDRVSDLIEENSLLINCIMDDLGGNSRCIIGEKLND